VFGEVEREYILYVQAVYMGGLFRSVSKYILNVPFFMSDIVAEQPNGYESNENAPFSY